MVRANNVKMVEFEVDVDFAEDVLDELAACEMAEVFNDEKIIADGDKSTWNEVMAKHLNENGRKHIKRLYDMVCHWYECNPEDAEAEGYTEW